MTEAVIAAMSKFLGKVSLLLLSYPKPKDIYAFYPSCSGLLNEKPCLVMLQYYKNNACSR